MCVCVFVGFVICGCVYCGFCNVCVCVCLRGFCNVWVCVCVGFIMCVYFGHMSTLTCIYCVFCLVSFMHIYSYSFCLSQFKACCHQRDNSIVFSSSRLVNNINNVCFFFGVNLTTPSILVFARRQISLERI